MSSSITARLPDSGAASARIGFKSTDNPYTVNSAEYFNWHAHWHREMAAIARSNRQHGDAEKYQKLAALYAKQAVYAGSAGVEI